MWSTVTVSPCAASTSVSLRYTCGLSSTPPPRSTTPRPSTHSTIISRLTFPRFSTLPVRRCRFPIAAVRLITRPAPCTVEYSARACISPSGDSGPAPLAPSRITASSPIDPPTNPFCPGNAGVAPLRTTTQVRPKCSSSQAKLWWLCTSSTSRPPTISTAFLAAHSRPA